MDLADPVTALRGVGPRLAERLARIGISCVQDLLLHLPLRCEDRTQCVPLAQLQAGAAALFEGTIVTTETRQGKRRSLRVVIEEGECRLILRFFHYAAGQERGFRPGLRMRAFGEVRETSGELECVHPDYKLFSDVPPPLETHLTPVYPSTEGLSQRLLRELVNTALPLLADLPDLLPEAEALGMPTLATALRELHAPPPTARCRGEDTSAPASALAEEPPAGAQAGDQAGAQRGALFPARARLVLEELCAHQLAVMLPASERPVVQAPRLLADGHLWQRLQQDLPFALTAAQTRVVGEIAVDLRRVLPMRRLLQGDVGSGKTLVAVGALLQAVESGYQGAFMAPTELLAQQHAGNLKGWLEPLGVRVLWVSGGQGVSARREISEQLASGEPLVAVGTHALFQEWISFARLGVVIIDEQHRFGVHQRMTMLEKGGDTVAHQLIMTATPIPRTLAMAMYAGFDKSILDSRPAGRKPVRTALIHSERRGEVIERIRLACARGVQAYWVCPLIETSELLAAQAAEETVCHLRAELPALCIETVHGRLPSAERDRIMKRFRAGEINLLVATTVIEVGVDVPNASLMIIENAERMGLAQLHQLRGRVGRGTAASACVLLYNEPLGVAARQRLEAMRRTDDGFEIAEVDLRIRGPGEMMGTRQTGVQAFRIANWERDQEWFERATELAQQISAEPQRAERLIRRWLGAAVRYADVG
jgi:ATP-dependent DNA helicase RecG